MAYEIAGVGAGDSPVLGGGGVHHDVGVDDFYEEVGDAFVGEEGVQEVQLEGLLFYD